MKNWATDKEWNPKSLFLLAASNPTISTSFDDGRLDETIAIAINQKHDRSFQINVDYMFGNKKFLMGSDLEKIEVEGVLLIKNISCLAENRPKTDAVGYVQFYEEDQSPSGAYVPAALVFNIFVIDELFSKIYKNISNKLYITGLRIEAEGEKGTLDAHAGGMYSYLSTWKTSQQNMLHLYNFSITFAQAAEVDSGNLKEVENQRVAVLDKLIKELNLIKITLYAIATVVAIGVGIRLVIG